MKYVLSALLFFSSVIYAQEKYYIFSELRGMEDYNGVTQLFYRKYTSSNDTTNNSFYRYNTQTKEETFFLSEVNSGDPFFNDSPVYANDFDFWNNDPDEYITLQTFCGFECSAIITINDTTILLDYLLSAGNKIEISAFDDSLIYAGIPFLVRSTDGGNTWMPDSFQIYFISSSPFQKDVFYALNNERQLLKTKDNAESFYVVDTSKSRFDGIDLYFDKQSAHVYMLTKNYNDFLFKTSNNSGEPFSWSVKYQSENEIFISVDYSNSGHIYLADGRFIYRSTDYGNTFNLYKEFDKKLVGIYKKPGSDILYAATKYDLYEINSDTIKTLKHLEIDPELFRWFPVSIGNKWIYDQRLDDGAFVYEYESVWEIKKYIEVENKYYIEFQIDRFNTPPHWENTSYKHYFRIDSASGKIYESFFSDNEIYEEEFVDLSIDPGDTVQVENGITFVSEKPFSLFDIESRKRKYFKIYPGFDIELVKDIGIYYHFGGELLWTGRILRGAVIDGEDYGDTILVVGIEDEKNLPTQFSLSQNYPNPFNPITSIQYAVGNPPAGRAGKQFVSLKIYDVLGNEIVTLVSEEKPAGEYEVEFSAGSYNLSSGIYFYTIKAGEFYQTNKMILLK